MWYNLELLLLFVSVEQKLSNAEPIDKCHSSFCEVGDSAMPKSTSLHKQVTRVV